VDERLIYSDFSYTRLLGIIESLNLKLCIVRAKNTIFTVVLYKLKQFQCCISTEFRH